MSSVLAMACLAAALVIAPPSSARRRHVALYPPGAAAASRVRALPVSALGVAVVAYLTGGFAALLAAGLLGGTLLRRFRRSVATRRHAAERQSLLDGLDVLIAELRVGAHPAAAAADAATDCTGPVARVLAVGAARARLGGSAADGLCDGAVDTDLAVRADVIRLVGAWRLAERHGLALAELLVASRADLAGRVGFGRRTEAALAGARASGAVLAGLPILGILLGQAMGAAPLRVLFGGGVGGLLLVLGTAFVGAGLLWTDAITGRVAP